MLAKNAQLAQLIRAIPKGIAVKQLPIRAASAALNPTEIEKEKPLEWDKAKPYKQIPNVGLLQFICYMLPGGRYHKMEFTDILFDLHRIHGPLYRLPGIFGKSEFLVSNDPSHFERVFRAEGPWPERQGQTLLGYHRSELQKDFYQGAEGVISTNGEKWSSFRFTVNPAMMQPKIVRQYYQKVSDVNKEFMQRIRDIRDGNSFEVPDNFEEEINRWTLESVAVVALDKQLGLLNAKLNDPRAKKLCDNISLSFLYAAKIQLRPSFWQYLPSSDFNKAVQTLDNIQELTISYVNEALQRIESGPADKPESEQSVLEKLLKIDKKIATVMAMDMLMAGVDTTSSTFVGCLLCLSKNPEKQAKLREEVLRILPEKDSDFTEASMNNMPYLRACIKETLRIYPLVTGIRRVIKSNIMLNNYQVPKETPVIMHSHALNKDDQHYPRCNEFLPERWLRQSKEKANDSQCPHALKPSNPFVYLPFGFGPRMCIGKRIADMELELGIARLVRNFHVEFNHPMEKPFRNQIINVPNIPLQFKFTDVEN